MAKAPIAAPVQAPHPPAWERMERVPKMPPPGVHQTSNSMPPPLHGQGPPRGGGGYQQHPPSGPMGYSMPPPQSHPSPPVIQQSHQPSTNSNHVPAPAVIATGKTSPTGPQYPGKFLKCQLASF